MIPSSKTVKKYSYSTVQQLLSTFTAEVSAIMNARPLIPVSTDPESPLILTPSVLLTMKTGSVPPLPGNFEQGLLLKVEQWKKKCKKTDPSSCHFMHSYSVSHDPSPHIGELCRKRHLRGFQQQSAAFTFLWLSWCPHWHQMKGVFVAWGGGL